MMMMRTEKENVDDFEDVEENVGALLKMERYASSPKPDDDDAGGRMKKEGGEISAYSYSWYSSRSPSSLWFLSQSNARRMLLCLLLGVFLGVTVSNVCFFAVDAKAKETNDDFKFASVAERSGDEPWVKHKENENEEYLAAMRYFQCTQTDKEAERKVVNLGTGGGLGSMLQFSWREFLGSKVNPTGKHAAVTLAGELKWYTANDECKQTPGYACFFWIQRARDTSIWGVRI